VDVRIEVVGNGAVEWIRTTTVLLPPAPQAGASASSATTAWIFSEIIIDGQKKSMQLFGRKATFGRRVF
jgi:hypothetical protein